MSEQINLAFTKLSLAEMEEVATYNALVKRKQEMEEQLKNQIKKNDESKNSLESLKIKEEKLRMIKKRAKESINVNREYLASLEYQLEVEKHKNSQIYKQYEILITEQKNRFKKQMEYYMQNPLAILHDEEMAKLTTIKIQVKIVQQAITEQKRKNKQFSDIQRQIAQINTVKLAQSFVDKTKSEEILRKKMEKEKEMMKKVSELERRKKKIDEQLKELKSHKSNANNDSTPKITSSTNISLDILTKKVISTSNNSMEVTENYSSTSHRTIQKPLTPNTYTHRSDIFRIPLRTENPLIMEKFKSQTNKKISHSKPIKVKENEEINKMELSPIIQRSKDESGPSSPKKMKPLESVKENYNPNIEPVASVSNCSTKELAEDQEDCKPKIIEIKIIKAATNDNQDNQNLLLNITEEEFSVKERRKATPYPNRDNLPEYSDEPSSSYTTNQSTNECASTTAQEHSLPLQITEEASATISPHESITSPPNSLSEFNFQNFGNDETSSNNDDEEPKNLASTESEKKSIGFRLFADKSETDTKREKREISFGFGPKSSAPKKKPTGFFFNML